MNGIIKKTSVLLLIATLASCALPQTRRRDYRGAPRKAPMRKQFTGLKKKIALLKFFNEAPYGGQDLGINATEELRKELSRTGEFVIDPMAGKIFGSSKEIYAGGGVKLAQLSRKAKGHGINLVVYGRVVDARIREKTDEIGVIRKTKSYSESKVEIRIFDISSNKEIYTDTIKGYADDSTFRFYNQQREERITYRAQLLRYSTRIAVRRMVPKILELSDKLDWVGQVAKIIGEKVYLNAGRKSGIQIGDILKVITEGEEIYDPETGALIGVSKGEVKGMIEIIDFFGPDGSIAVLHSGGSVQENDFVQLY